MSAVEKLQPTLPSAASNVPAQGTPGMSSPLSTIAPTPMQMLQMAVERGSDLTVLEKLMDLQERWERNEARRAYVAALSQFKAQAPTLTKNKHVGYESRRTGDRTEYDYASLDQVCAVIGPALSKHGLSHTWETKQADGLVIVTCILTHELGHSERVSLSAGADASGSKNSIQAIGSTVTYLQRYTLLAITGLAVSGQDNDGSTPMSPISAEQKDELIALMKASGTDTKRFLDYFGVATLDELPALSFDNAKAALARKKGKQQ